MSIKQIIGLFCSALLLSCTASAQSYLHAEGQYILNEQGEQVLLRGMGLGGWMLQEGYMLQLGNLGQQHVMQAKFEDLIGTESTKAFYDAWLNNHTRKADIDAMAKWGFNSVRLPMHYNLYTLPVEQEKVKGKNTWLDKGFEMTDALLAWCKANNMYLILDLHATPGGQGNDVAISDRDPKKPSLWQSEANQQKMIDLWRKLAERYANEPMIGGYDIINEPNWPFDGTSKNGCDEQKNIPLKNLMVKITKTIREVDSKHLIIIEGNCWGNNYKGLLPTWDKNMALSFHKYWNNNNEIDISEFLTLREKYNVPLWMGESGENSNLWFTDAIHLVESKGIGWAFWPLKKIGFNNPLQVAANEDYTAVVEYLNGRGKRPSREQATRALMQLAQHDIQYENNIYHPDVIDAMFRQPHSETAKSFGLHVIPSAGGSVNAVDYDMGRNSYFDVDSANYHVSTKGERTPWNRGLIYRNDGVDIGVDKKIATSPYYITNTETGEWMQYTLNVEKAGDYAFIASVTSNSDDAQIEVILNNERVTAPVSIAKNDQWTAQFIANLHLSAGTNTLKLKTVKGGYHISTLSFEPVAAH